MRTETHFAQGVQCRHKAEQTFLLKPEHLLKCQVEHTLYLRDGTLGTSQVHFVGLVPFKNRSCQQELFVKDKENIRKTNTKQIKSK